jgi:hypothetical protein
MTHAEDLNNGPAFPVQNNRISAAHVCGILLLNRQFALRAKRKALDDLGLGDRGSELALSRVGGRLSGRSVGQKEAQHF